jgi:hypothetical protein
LKTADKAFSVRLVSFGEGLSLDEAFKLDAAIHAVPVLEAPVADHVKWFGKVL